jgi:serine/threonine protein kinase
MSQTNTVIINKKYKILEKIGEGSFGSIYKGENCRSQELVAIKVEPISSNFKLLKNESKIYQYLINNEGFPSVKWFGKDDYNYYMVIDLLGESLQSLMMQKQSFSLKLVLQIGIQIISLLQVLHENGFVHRDIKPDNFLLGLNSKSKQIHIIDFGFCKRYLISGKHIDSSLRSSNIIGTPSFISINAHNLHELSRRDDLESLGYMLLYFNNGGNLPWSEINNNEMMMTMKTFFMNNGEAQEEGQEVEVNVENNVLLEFITTVRKLHFSETPNYKELIKLLRSQIDKI